MTGIVAGVDLGGTTARVGTFDSTGKLHHFLEKPIEAINGPQKGITRIGNMVAECVRCSGGELIGIGMGVSGPLDREKGIIQNPYTLPGWANVPILEMLEARFRVPT